MARPGQAAPRGLHGLRVVQCPAGKRDWLTGAVNRVETRARRPLGSKVWFGGSGFGVRHQGAGTLAGRSGF